MLTLVPCTAADAATVAQLWNARRFDSGSCWAQAAVAEPATILALLAAGMTIRLAVDDDVLVGFGLWTLGGDQARLVALAAADDAVYYRLLGAFCEWSLAQQCPRGFAELGANATIERARMDALGVIEYTPIGFAPLLPGQHAGQRVPSVWRAACDCTVLLAAIAALPEVSP